MLQLLTGPAGTGKTEFCLARYRQELQASARAGEIGTTFWITPSHRSARQIQQRLLTADFRCCWSPGVITFEQFAERILRGSGLPVSLLNQAERRMLVKAVVRESAGAGELQFFHKVQQTNGFATQLGRFIAELKREETWPEAFLDLLSEREYASRKDQELGQLYRRYQDWLHQHNKYDAEGRFWLARTELAARGSAIFPRLRLIVVDGFVDFTGTQQDMLLQLASRAQDVLVTLPADRHGEREELFWKAGLTRRGLLAAARAINIPVEELSPASAAVAAIKPSPRPAGLRTLAEDLFGNSREQTPGNNAAGLTCLAALGPRAEVREVGRRVKQLLLQGTPASEILVCVRQFDTYAALLESLWSDAGIPFVIEQSRPVAQLGLARSMSALYDVLREDWSFATLKKLLRHTPLFLPDWQGTGREASAVLSSLRQLNLQGGRSEILDRLQGLASQMQARNETSDELAAEGAEASSDGRTDPSQPVIEEAWRGEYAVALAALQQLDRIFRVHSKTQTYTEHTLQLLATARELFQHPAEWSQGTAGDVELSAFAATANERSLAEQWDFLAGLLRSAAEFQDTLATGGTAVCDWRTFADWLDDQFRFQKLPPRKPATGEVSVLEATDARHLQTRYLFVLGMHEGTFPGRDGNPPFYGEQERQAWNERGLPLSVRSQQHRDELQFFYRLVTRADHVVLSYSRVTGTGGPQYSSPFYRAVRERFTPAALPEEFVGQLSPMPAAGSLLTASDCRIQAVLEMQQGQPELMCWWGTRPERQLSFYSLQAAARMNSHRFEQTGMTAYEGMLASGAQRAWLAARFGPDYTFSASRLEAYATCPFRFFLDYIIKLRPFEAPRLATDHSRRGNVVHDLLAELHAGPPDSPDLFSAGGEAGDSLAPLAAKFVELIEARFARRFTKSALQLALDLVEQQLLTEWAGLYSEQAADYHEKYGPGAGAEFQPQFREVAFGSSHERARGEGASGNTLPPVRFGGAGESVLVEGRIDRIDVAEHEGQRLYAIIDYKTGEPPKVKEEAVSRGTQLQLALYAVAVTRLQLLGPDATPWTIGYWGLREKGYQPQFKAPRKRKFEPLTAEFLAYWEAELDRLIPRLVAALRNGEFPVFNENRHCGDRCPYSTVCRVSQIRPLAEPLQKLWSLEGSVETR